MGFGVTQGVTFCNVNPSILLSNMHIAQRLKNLNFNSFVTLAFQELENMKLDRYIGVLSLSLPWTWPVVSQPIQNDPLLNWSWAKTTTETQSEDFLIHDGFKKRIFKLHKKNVHWEAEY
jgi:hypothetical protein